MQGKDTMQPEALAEKASHLKQCIGHLRNLVNLPVTESTNHDGIQNAADKAYLEAHQFDPRDFNMEKGVRIEKDVCTKKDVYIETISYEGMRPLSASASDLEMQLQDRSMELVDVLYSLRKTPTKLDAYRPQLVSMITTLDSLYNDLIPKDEDEKAPYMPTTWFKDEFGIPASRLRAARRRQKLAAKDLSRDGERPSYHYSVPNAMKLWPTDVTYLPNPASESKT